MRLIVLASGSARNGYILTNDKETLLIEAGCKLVEVKKALNYDMSTIVGCLISHSHGDHSGYLNSYLKAGIMVLASEDTLVEKEVKTMRYMTKAVSSDKGYKVGGFKIIPFDVTHDVKCFGYLIEHDDMGRLVFMTDTCRVDYTFPPLNHWLIEANYAHDILNMNIIEGRISAAMRPRLLKSHLEIDECKDILQSNDLSQVNNIILIHLSNGNSDQKRFEDEIRALIGKPVKAAEKGLIVELGIKPY